MTSKLDRPASTPAAAAGGAGGALDELAAVVVNWGTAELTIRCVRALVADGVPPGRVVVVDNGSEDDSHARLRRELPECPHLRIEKNVGYARAANAGARLLPGASAYLFVNNDAFVHRPGSVPALVASLGDASVGIVVARILNEDLTLQRQTVPIRTPAVALALATGFAWLVPNRWQPRWGWRWDHSVSREIPASGAVAMLVRGETWERLGGFAELAWLYGEDLDLCWRARNLGQKVWFTTEAEFVHLEAGSTRKHYDHVKRAELTARAEVEIIRRNLPPLASRVSLALIGCGMVWPAVYHALAGHREAAARSLAYLRGHLAAMREPRPRAA
ncbi:MAG TPA: glycosyltransferase [Gaiellaceae bacterium]|nr:glycosyltransferase [Gaiellaceae bacterium]